MVENTHASSYADINFSLHSAFNASLKTCRDVDEYNVKKSKIDEYNVLTKINWHNC